MEPISVPKHSDLAVQIRSLRQSYPQQAPSAQTNLNKSDSGKDGQIARFKERISALEEQVRSLKEENELLYGKLANNRSP
jgi:polyhydroxyalkanoate synthesis regulator phasin